MKNWTFKEKVEFIKRELANRLELAEDQAKDHLAEIRKEMEKEVSAIHGIAYQLQWRTPDILKSAEDVKNWKSVNEWFNKETDEDGNEINSHMRVQELTHMKDWHTDRALRSPGDVRVNGHGIQEIAQHQSELEVAKKLVELHEYINR